MKHDLVKPNPMHNPLDDTTDSRRALWSRRVPQQETDADFVWGEKAVSIIDRFEKIVARYPDRIAIQTEDQSVSYETLNRFANGIAHAIAGKSLDFNRPVVILTRDPIAGIAAMLGALKAGKTYVVFDSELPRKRLEVLYGECNSDCVLVTEEEIAIGRSFIGDEATILKLDNSNITPSNSNPKMHVSEGSPAAIFFTSGSSGRPKGVIFPRRSLFKNVENTIISNRLSCRDRIWLSSFHLGGRAAQTIFSGLLSGATLLTFDLALKGFASFSAWLKHERVSVVYFVPSMLSRFTDSLDRTDDFPDIRLLALGGESISLSDIQLYRNHFSNDCVLRLGFGVTEACALVTEVFVSRDTPLDDEVPVGFAVDGYEVRIVDREGSILPEGEVGEIVIQSQFVSPGYWGRPDLTKQKFQELPGETGSILYRTGDQGYLSAEGCLFHRGRLDFEVKVRGQRVNLAEVRDSLMEVEGVTEAAVVDYLTSSGDVRLFAFVVTSDPKLTETAIREHLRQELPSFMIPSRCVQLSELPLMPSGKLDREALVARITKTSGVDDQVVTPRDAMEQHIAQLWSEVLDSVEYGVHDSFFDVGGDSLLSMQLIARVEKEFKIEFSGKEFFLIPTIENMASLVRASNHADLQVSDGDGVRIATSNKSIRSEPEGLRKLIDSLEADGGTPEKTLMITWNRRRRILNVVGNSLPYWMVFRSLEYVAKKPWIRRALFRWKIKLIREFMSVINSDIDPDSMIEKSLVYGTLRMSNVGNWNFFPKNPQQAEHVAAQITTEGEERLEYAVKQKRGVILVSAHSIASRSASMVVPINYFVGSVIAQLRQAKLEPEMEGSFLAYKLDVARKVLRQGGLVGMAADGLHGDSGGFQSNFHGRRRNFRTGFADLALLTGALVVPVIHSITEEGLLKITFGESFDAGDDSMAHAERVELLMKQYIQMMDQMWVHNPWMLNFWQMRKHLSLPIID